ncbi:MAG: Flagellar protein FliS [Candidatus Scalindua rubra]|uniref:Flagellar secretion chaperone FliS n=1 Tax=Candidatus Scalindua rubra TaxID=1872076 RepID=A0A1E3XA24_9BACT|nr:MAG: Flagellar protein FliS [Candidatus Scalindua rubra]
METQKTDSYKKLQVETADQTSLILMLYDRAIFLLDKAKNDILEKQYEEKNNSLKKATDIIFELLTSLDKDKGGEIAVSLARLYNFVIREITDANANLNTKALDNAKRILSELRDSWVNIKNNPNTEINNTNNTTTNIDLSG